MAPNRAVAKKHTTHWLLWCLTLLDNKFKLILVAPFKAWFSHGRSSQLLEASSIDWAYTHTCPIFSNGTWHTSNLLMWRKVLPFSSGDLEFQIWACWNGPGTSKENIPEESWRRIAWVETVPEFLYISILSIYICVCVCRVVSWHVMSCHVMYVCMYVWNYI
jgi:hypothetical protein